MGKWEKNRKGWLKIITIASIILFISGTKHLGAAAEPDLLFYASFDGTVAADFATGSAKPKTVYGTPLFEPGVRGKALVGAEAGALLLYLTQDNILPQKGTVAMWVKPVDWALDKGNFHAFFVSQSPKGWLQLYTIPEDGSLQMLVGNSSGGWRVGYWSTGKILSNNVLSENKWLHIVGTWDAGKISLYVNGEFMSSDAYDMINGSRGGPPTQLGEIFSVGDDQWARARSAPRKTLIDEFKVYSRPFSPGEVKELYRSYNTEEKKQTVQPHRLVVVKTAKPPVVDGVLSKMDWEEFEWHRAPALSGFIDVRDQKFAGRQATAWFTYDNERLYFAFASDIPPGSQPVANIRERDGQVWGDDAIEFFISPPGEAEKEKPLYFQFIGNSANVFYDGKQGDVSWNGSWAYQAKAGSQQWIAEGSIRWQDLGLNSPKDGEIWRLNFARDWQNPQAWTVWGHTDNFQEVPEFACLTFRDRGTVAQVETLGKFTSGNIAFDVTLINSGGSYTDKVVGTLSAGENKFTADALVPSDGEAKLKFRTTITDKKADTMALKIASETTGDVLWEGSFPFDWTDQITVELSPRPAKGVIEVNLDIAGLADCPKSPAASIAFFKSGTTEKVAEFQSSPFDEKKRSFTPVPIDRIPVGSYDVLVKIFKENTVVAEARTRFDRRDEPWLGNTVGITDQVVPPWTPIEVTGKTMKCWGREVSFNNTLFPSQIITRQAEILATPIRLEAVVSGKPIGWNKTTLDIIKQTPARVDFTTSAISENMRVENEAYLEEDGMFFFKVHLIPLVTKVKLDRLTLVIPLKNENAIFFDRPDLPVYRQPLKERAGRLPKGTGSIWNSSFNEYLWVGDYDRGLSWFAEENTAWNISDSTRVLELIRTGNTVELQIHFADAPMVISAPHTITFGLHPTPVKPLPKGWRLWNMDAQIGAGPNVAWSFPHTTKYFGYPEAPDPVFIKYYTDENRKRGRIVVPYMHPVRIGANSPEWQYYGRDWAMPGVDSGRESPDVIQFSDAHMGVCPGAPAFRDWMAWKNKQYLETTGYSGLYYDHSTPFPCSAQNHEHKPGAVPILAYREHYRRLYTLAKEIDPNNVIATHVSFGMVMPVESFADITIPGEELSYIINTKPETVTDDLLDITDFDLDYYLAWYMGRQYGLVPVFLAGASSKGRHHSGYQLLTDSIGSWRSDLPLIQVYQDLGMDADDVEFLPFWSNNKIIQARFANAPDGITGEKYPQPLVSAYRRPDKFIMFAVVNLTKAKQRVGVRFDAKALGLNLSEYALVDAYPRYPLFAGQDNFEVEIEERSYRLILLQKRNPGETVQPAVSLIPDIFHKSTDYYFSGIAVAGTGIIPGEGKGSLLVGDIGDAATTRQSHLAQTFTLTKPTKIERIDLQGKGISWVKCEFFGNVSGLPHPFDLRIYKTNADGTPSDQMADPKAWTWLGGLGTTMATHPFNFRESFVLPSGRYVFVLSHPPQPFPPERRINLGVPIWEPERLSGEESFTRESGSAKWQKANGVISFSIVGYER